MNTKKKNPFPLRNFRGVNLAVIVKLESVGLKKAEQLLIATKTPSMRKELASKLRISEASLLELVKLSDLSRLPGVKGIRARLYYDAGVDCVKKLASFEPPDLLKLTQEFVERTGFRGIPPQPEEVNSTIANARQLPEVIDW